jgi:hypothetical protein
VAGVQALELNAVQQTAGLGAPHMNCGERKGVNWKIPTLFCCRLFWPHTTISDELALGKLCAYKEIKERLKERQLR